MFNSDGLCNACTNYQERPQIDWDNRKTDFQKIIDNHKSTDGSWDCVIPVSGGKDSTYQAIYMKEAGLNPLCVNSRTCDLSTLGRENLDNLRSLGFDLIEVLPNPLVRSKLNKIGLTQVGDISWPEHIGMFTIPFTIAQKFNIPLIIYGENSQHEYGGPENLAKNNYQDRRWLEEIGGTLGLRVSDVIGLDGLTENDLHIYRFPTESELAKSKITALYLGHYIPWNGIENYLIAQAYGLKTYHSAVEGSLVNYENVDNHQNGIHEYFKFIKHGYGRTTDQVSILIRRGLMNRARALDIVKQRDGNFPWSYLGKSLDDILRPLDISIDEFIKICDRFTNKKLFKTDSKGMLIRDQNGNLIKINYDNV